jgi:hypothetical protein
VAQDCACCAVWLMVWVPKISRGFLPLWEGWRATSSPRIGNPNSFSAVRHVLHPVDEPSRNQPYYDLASGESTRDCLSDICDWGAPWIRHAAGCDESFNDAFFCGNFSHAVLVPFRRFGARG